MNKRSMLMGLVLATMSANINATYKSQIGNEWSGCPVPPDFGKNKKFKKKQDKRKKR